MPKTTWLLRIASVYAFWLRVFGPTRRPRCETMTSPNTSLPPPSAPMLYRRSAVSGLGWLPLSASSTRPSKTASALSTEDSSPCNRISFPRTITSHSTSSSTRRNIVSRSPKTSSMRPGGTTSLTSTSLLALVSVFPPNLLPLHPTLALQPIPRECGEPPAICPVPGEGVRPAHHRAHVLHARGPSLL